MHKTNTRSRTQKFMRTALRRKPCMGLTVSMSLVIPVLLLLCTFFFFWIRGSIYRLDLSKRDLRILKSRGDQISFHHCPYQEPEYYSINFCSLFCGEMAIAWRMQYLKKDVFLPATCLDKHEHVLCHQDHKCLPGSPARLKRCPGTIETRLGKDYSEQKLVPLYSENLTDILGKTVLANQLIARCPSCDIRSDTFKFKEEGQCFRKLNTNQSGWPGTWQYCANLERMDQTVECNINLDKNPDTKE